VLDKVTIAGVDVPMICRGTTETWEEEPFFYYVSERGCWCGKAPSTTTYELLASWVAPPVWWREKLATARSIRKRERRSDVLRLSYQVEKK
jgi:hypothetical protein